VLRLALQKSGRLSDDALALIEACDIRFNRAKDKLRTVTDNFSLELLFLRDDDIPGYVADGVADAGIVGENVLLETGAPLEVVERLGFGRCRLSIALPRGIVYPGREALNGLHIATSYPRLLTNFLAQHGLTATIHKISGSVEIAPGLGLADAICDLVSTGGTLLSNGLQEVEAILHSEALLVAHPTLADPQRRLLDALAFRIRSVRRAQRFKYILLNAPNETLSQVIALLPGMKSPTVMPLAASGWSSVHSVIEEDAFWEVIEQLHGLGAQGILVIPIEKMVQ
jgi:ATP phosphoribosyltransferase